jgi:hypothetical protein
MRRKIIRGSFGAIALGCIAFFIIGMTPTDEKLFWGFHNKRLRGNYVSQLSGTINYPEESPFSLFNGPFCLTGLVSVDGKGNAWGTMHDNYNGMLFNYSWEGTYDVNPDGTLLIDAYYELDGTDMYVQFFGVLCDRGKQVRLMYVGPIPENASPPNMLYATIIGSWIRQ